MTHVLVKMFIKLNEHSVKTFLNTQSIHFDIYRRGVQIKSRHLASSEDTVPVEGGRKVDASRNVIVV